MDILQQLGELALGSRFKRISDRLMQDGIKIYSDHNIDFEPRWFPMFSLFYRYPGCYSVTEIAKKIGVSHVSVNQISKEMIKKGVLRSKKDKKDKRKNMLELTSKGEGLIDNLTEIWEEIYAAIREITNATGYDIIDVLEKLEKEMNQKSLHERYNEQNKKKQLSTVQIFEYSSEHKKVFATLNYEWLEKYFYVEDKDKEILKNPEKYIIAPGGHIFFAKYRNEIVGTCALIKHSDGKYELAKMAVTENAKGKQIGKKLAIAVIDKAKEIGTSSIFLETNSGLVPAINLYRKVGFKMNADLKPVYDRGDVMMTLHL
ncbi:GNAT family N-acetyltransferase [Candidatus Uabimicrobium sp. HlEnr_7]|uniref:bifunctional helix-turn-helix transcriptional regulator/GNAT family N-acetyltransferase n=1 Tax=Candidatus Uabimicrobium helgolandensis TaxID=3095367 RepID=UPI0035563B39